MKLAITASKLLLFPLNSLYPIYFWFHLTFREKLAERAGHILANREIDSLQNILKIFPHTQIFFILFIFQSLKWWPFAIHAFSIIFLPDDIA